MSISNPSDGWPTNFRSKRKIDYYRRPYNKKRPNNRHDDLGGTSSKVTNLYDKLLSPSQIEVLSYGLSFSPSSHFDLFTAVKDLHLFAGYLQKVFSSQKLTTHTEQEA